MGAGGTRAGRGGGTGRRWHDDGVGLDESLAEVLQRPAAVAAPRLLGAVLSHTVRGVRVGVRITEVEAYDEDDPASHTFGGRSRRNEVMFSSAGHLYTYRSHGIHVCANVVADAAGRGAAVLVRGGVVVTGRADAVHRRGGRDGDDWLAAGPGRLCQALGMGLEQGGAWLLGPHDPSLVAGAPWPWPVLVGPRVGVSRAPDRPWRWWVPDAGGVSTYRRSPRADR